jgi:hypothetical protein
MLKLKEITLFVLGENFRDFSLWRCENPCKSDQALNNPSFTPDLRSVTYSQ